MPVLLRIRDEMGPSVGIRCDLPQMSVRIPPTDPLQFQPGAMGRPLEMDRKRFEGTYDLTEFLQISDVRYRLVGILKPSERVIPRLAIT